MNLIDLIKLDVPMFCLTPTYEQAEKEIFYVKDEKIYKTTTDVLDFNSGGNFVLFLKHYTDVAHKFKMTEIDDKRTIKAILDYGHLLKE